MAEVPASRVMAAASRETGIRAVAAASQGMGVQAVTVVVAAESQDAAIRVADLCSWFPLLDP